MKVVVDSEILINLWWHIMNIWNANKFVFTRIQKKTYLSIKNRSFNLHKRQIIFLIRISILLMRWIYFKNNTIITYITSNFNFVCRLTTVVIKKQKINVSDPVNCITSSQSSGCWLTHIRLVFRNDNKIVRK